MNLTYIASKAIDLLTFTQDRNPDNASTIGTLMRNVGFDAGLENPKLRNKIHAIGDNGEKLTAIVDFAIPLLLSQIIEKADNPEDKGILEEKEKTVRDTIEAALLTAVCNLTIAQRDAFEKLLGMVKELAISVAEIQGDDVKGSGVYQEYKAFKEQQNSDLKIDGMVAFIEKYKGIVRADESQLKMILNQEGDLEALFDQEIERLKVLASQSKSDVQIKYVLGALLQATEFNANSMAFVLDDYETYEHKKEAKERFSSYLKKVNDVTFPNGLAEVMPSFVVSNLLSGSTYITNLSNIDWWRDEFAAEKAAEFYAAARDGVKRFKDPVQAKFGDDSVKVVETASDYILQAGMEQFLGKTLTPENLEVLKFLEDAFKDLLQDHEHFSVVGEFKKKLIMQLKRSSSK